MSGSLAARVESFRDMRVVVVGDVMLDSYLHGTASRLSREAPVPIVSLERREAVPGGAGNTAVNVRTLGASVELIAVVGPDADGERLRQVLESRGVGTRGLVTSGCATTLAKHRVVAADQMLLRFDTGSRIDPDGETEDALARSLAELVPAADAVIVSDYGYGVMGSRLVATLSEFQAASPRVLVADARDLRRYRRVGVTAVKPNYGEVVRLLGEPEERDARLRPAQVALHGERILDLCGAHMAAVTLDTDGAILFERQRPTYRTYARPTSHSRAAGAGDTFVGALALALASGASGPEATELASASAAVVVSKEGTAACSAFELEEYVLATARRIESRDRLARRLASYREQGRTIVFTNGCFDILHRGHITYLNRAKALGDVLVVGINADESVRRLKGEGRPVNGLDDRAQVLAALSCVDHVVPFEEDTPEDLIRLIRPAVFVKGGDYTHDTLPEARLVESLGGTVRILPYVENRSTSSLVERLRHLPTGARLAGRATGKQGAASARRPRRRGEAVRE